MIERYKISLIILLALVVRLYHIDFPVAGWHSWRQADTAAMARNFAEDGFQFLHPQIDWRGDTAGFVESEFPLYAYTAALLDALLGFSDMWGRMLSVLCSLAAIWGLYHLLRKYLSAQAATWGALIYAIMPLNIYYGRAFMPESAMLMCSVLGIYWFSEWLDGREAKYFFLSWVCVALAALLKLPTLYLGLPLLFLAWTKYGKSFAGNWQLWLFAFLVFVSVGLWYYHAHQLYLQTGLTFGIWEAGTDKWANFDMIITPKFYNDVFFKSFAERHLTYAGFIPFVIGLFVSRTSKSERVFDWWLIALLVYVLIVARGNQVHEYYQLPFALPAVAYVGKVFARYMPISSLRELVKMGSFRGLFFRLCLVGIVVLSFLRYSNFMNGETTDAPLFRLAADVQSTTSRTDLIVALSEGNPVVLYRCDRKGWNASVDQVDPAFLREKWERGARFIVGEKEPFNTPERQRRLDKLMTTLPAVKNERDHFILRLDYEDTEGSAAHGFNPSQ